MALKSSFTGKVKVIRAEAPYGPLYSVKISKKDMKGNWITAILPIRFKKGVELADGEEIEVTRSWLDFYINKHNKAVLQIFCMEFNKANQMLNDTSTDYIPYDYDMNY